MNSTLIRSAAPVFAALLWSASASANLIQNGSFESLDDGNLDQVFYETVNPGETTILNWTVSGNVTRSVDVVREGTIASSADWAQDGQYAIDMAGTPGPASLSQGVSAAVVGQAYLLTFWTSSNGSSITGGIDVFWNNLNLLTSAIVSPSQGTWAQHSFTVYGTAGLDVLRFQDLMGGNQGVLLDNVSLTAVPVPPAALLFGSVLFGFAVVARKRNAQFTA